MLLPDSSVYEMHDRGAVVLFPEGARVFLFPKTTQIVLLFSGYRGALCQQERGQQWRTEVGGGEFGGFNPLPKIPKSLQNRAKLNPIVKTSKLPNLGRQHPKMFGKKAVKF